MYMQFLHFLGGNFADDIFCILILDHDSDPFITGPSGGEGGPCLRIQLSLAWAKFSGGENIIGSFHLFILVGSVSLYWVPLSRLEQ